MVNGQMEDDTLVVELNGRIDSSDSEQVEKEVFDLIASNKPNKIIFEAKNLNYISSAGLRVILKVIQQSKEKVVMRNVNSEVGEILHVTGFNTLMKVERALRDVSVDGCEIIGRGGNGCVYRLDEDTIIKVFTNNTPLEDIEKERKLAQTAFLLGIPTAISYDIVRVNDVYGLVFEMIKAETISVLMNKEPEKYGTIFGTLLKKIHSTKVDTSKLSSTKDAYKGFIDKIKERITEEEYLKLNNFIDSIPDRDTLIHGDYHPGNIMIQNGEPILIDMGDIGYGHPIFDLAGVYASTISAAKQAPDHLKQFMGLEIESTYRTYDAFIKAYFETEDAQKIEQINQVLGAYSMLKALMGVVQGKNLNEELKNRCIESLRRYLFPAIDQIGSMLPLLNI